MINLKLLATIRIDKLGKKWLHAPCFKMVGNLALALDVSSFEGKSAFEICGYKRDNKSQLIVTILEKDVLNFVDCKPKYFHFENSVQ